MEVFQVCLYMEEVQRLYRHTDNVSLGRIKKETFRNFNQRE